MKPISNKRHQAWPKPGEAIVARRSTRQVAEQVCRYNAMKDLIKSEIKLVENISSKIYRVGSCTKQ